MKVALDTNILAYAEGTNGDSVARYHHEAPVVRLISDDTTAATAYKPVELHVAIFRKLVAHPSD